MNIAQAGLLIFMVICFIVVRYTGIAREIEKKGISKITLDDCVYGILLLVCILGITIPLMWILQEAGLFCQN